jgi:dTDP-4-dehydrorhamnose 3,5-epimerase
MVFHDGPIDGVRWLRLQKFHDGRGWLCELFRSDDLPPEIFPAMAYLSVTDVGVARGPHEHVDQSDYFCFLGPSSFKVYLWDSRRQSPTYCACQREVVGEHKPMALIVPPGVVHAYKNVGSVPGLVVNCPNRLYKGRGRKEPVDEIRHEERADSMFALD